MAPFFSRSHRRQEPANLLADYGYAVLDFETTGFDADGNDRIVEIAVVQLSPDLQVEAEYTSLVNPARDLGPTHIHGILGSDVREAPVFAEVADDMVVWLAGRVIVAHNAPFDIRFLRAEFTRLGHTLPELAAVDTLALTRVKLEEACRAYAIDLRDAHTALGDARATAALFRALLEKRFRKARDLRGLGCSIAPPPLEAWPVLTFEPTSHRRPAKARSTPPDQTSIVVERGMTVCFTGNSGLWVDGGPLDRATEQRLAENAGLVVKRSVIKNLTYLVAADLDSLSGKAKQARQKGVSSVPQEAFWRALGVDVRPAPP